MRRLLPTLRLSHPLLLAAVSAGALLACTYDFDHFESASGDGGSEPGATAGRGSGSSSSGSSDSGGSDSGGANSGSGGANSGSGGSSSGSSDSGGSNSSSGSSSTAVGGAEDAGGAGGSSGSSGAGHEGGSPAGAGGASEGFDCQAVHGTPSGTHCYFLVGGDARLSWAAAQTACENQGSHLVTVTSSSESNLLKQAFFPAAHDVWLGLSLADRATQPPPKSCSESSCPFRWVTGEAVSYTNWDRHLVSDDEPNYSGPCVRSLNADAKWADLDCDTKLLGICEHE